MQNQGIFTQTTGRGLFILFLLYQQLSNVLYHLNHMIQGDQHGCVTSFTACLYVALQSLRLYLQSGIDNLTQYLPFRYFTGAAERKRKKNMVLAVPYCIECNHQRKKL